MQVTLLRALIAVPALLMLTAAPLAVAMPRLHLVSMCTAEGPQLVLLEGEGPTRPANERRLSCAHALCPREILPSGKARGRA